MIIPVPRHVCAEVPCECGSYVAQKEIESHAVEGGADLTPSRPSSAKRQGTMGPVRDLEYSERANKLRRCHTA